MHMSQCWVWFFCFCLCQFTMILYTVLSDPCSHFTSLQSARAMYMYTVIPINDNVDLWSGCQNKTHLRCRHVRNIQEQKMHGSWDSTMRWSVVSLHNKFLEQLNDHQLVTALQPYQAVIYIVKTIPYLKQKLLLLGLFPQGKADDLWCWSPTLF